MAALDLDHLVINTRFDTLAAEDLFRQLGFTLTPRGHHAFGSVNHLMVFGNDYLELIGLPEEGTVLRQEILDSPSGIDGLVFQARDADSVHTWLTERGLPIQPLHAFTRPVQIDGQTFDASFRTVRFQPGYFPAGRVYFCQHETPELIWRRTWQKHANQARRLAGLAIVSGDPANDAEKYADVAQGTAVRDSNGVYRIHGRQHALVVYSHEAYQARYGDLACERRPAFFGAIGVGVESPVPLRAALQRLGSRVQYRLTPGRTTLRIPEFNTLLDFLHGDDDL